MRALSPVLIALLICVAFIRPVAAEDVQGQAKQLIDQQIKAFLHDDPETAYSFASPGIKALFPNKEAFFAVVKKSYEPVYHPGNYAFGRSKSDNNDAILYQEVLITGTDGQDWSAIYQLARQPDGSYKINGVQIVPNTTSKGI